MIATDYRILGTIFLVVAFCLVSVPAQAKYGGGTGEPNEPYLIYTAEQMNEIGLHEEDWQKHFKLMSDIDLSSYTGTSFNLIGTSHNLFWGVFDGNDHTILNFTYKYRADRDATALFSHVGSWGLIKDLGLIGPNVDAGAGKNAGALVGENMGTITGCYAHGGSVSGKDYVGGLVGYNLGTIINCYSTGSVSGNKAAPFASYNVGGLVGFSGRTITNCYAVAVVTGDQFVGGLAGNAHTITESYASGSVSGSEYVGGLAGYGGATITNCYSLASVSGYQWVGGLVGLNGSTSPSTITNCYATGNVTGTTDVGGLVGLNRNGSVQNSFWDTQNSGQSTSDGGTGITTAEMWMKSTFTDASWDFVGESVNGTEDIWCICEGAGYPKLTWQFVIGDFDGDDETDFVDFSILAAHWLQTNGSFWCGTGGIDLTDDGKVGFDDLKEFAENWLAEDIWRLMEADYVTVDDFESYGDANDPGPPPPPGSRIWYSWRDGLGWTKPYKQPGNGTGSMVDLELTQVHRGAQALNYQYNNGGPPYYSLAEVKVSELTSGIGGDWTKEGIAVLSLWFRGDASNATAPMSVVLNGSSAVYHDNPNAARINTWTEWTIDLQAFTGVDLANVNSIAICFGDKNNQLPGGSGMVIFDDIRLYGAR
jgi:hypothetical protein